jgi:glycosyltransferase involved in cell wall biosynthesis
MHATCRQPEHKGGGLGYAAPLDNPRRRPASHERGSMSPSRRIAFLVWRDTLHPEGGGSELFVERIAAWLASQGHDVTIACAAHGNAPRDEIREGVRFRRRGGRLTVYPHGLAYLLSPAGRRTDIVVDVQNGLPFFASLVRRRGVVTLVHHVHREQWQIIYPGWRGHLGWWLESRAAPRLFRGRYLTVSEASRADLVGLGIDGARIRVVHNGLDIPRPSRTVPRSTVPTICVLGRLVPHKRVEHALEVAARLRPTMIDLRVEVIGDGWWRQELEGRARALGVDDIVRFHGHVSQIERARILDRSWLLVAPSIKEGWGIAIMEAAARGVPALAYRTAGGVRESIIDGETGKLVDDLDELAKATDELLADASIRERMGAAASARAAEYDWTRAARRFADSLPIDQRLP